MICTDESIDKIRVVAAERAERLAAAYDIDSDTKTAFVHDMTLEVVEIARAFLKAADEIQARNERAFVGSAPNRALRRKAISKLRRK